MAGRGGKKEDLYCFPFLTFTVKTKITGDATLGSIIETKTQLLTTWATDIWLKPSSVFMELG